MTSEELEKYLESIGGLILSYKDKKITRFGVEDGWNQLIHDLVEELIQSGWDKKISQVKEKFGGLRFYIENGNIEFNKIISKYENLSYAICETCGKPGEIDKSKGWLKTVCEEHKILRNEK